MYVCINSFISSSSASITSVEPVPFPDAVELNRYHASNNKATDIPHYEMTAAYEYVDNEPAYDKPSNDNHNNRSVSAPYETIPGEEDEGTYETPDTGALRT